MLNFTFLSVDKKSNEDLKEFMSDEYNSYLQSKIYCAQSNNESMNAVLPISFLEFFTVPEGTPIEEPDKISEESYN